MEITRLKRSVCRLCESKNMELVIPLAPTPVAEKYLANPENTEVSAIWIGGSPVIVTQIW